ncbi:META domain-containing protein [Prolixibacteraceae bacterium Z1-6]|uniref:META domain-containing protein n=1 Tax=Draconibacterium aestuarii TaxID=2998507 RepID=A0A9X3F6G6_9BACT|nr:META domain-containing protein [Prolixibacteraceae bacterium Z1-6]
MKKSVFNLFVFMFLFALTACDNDDCSCDDEIYGKWEAKEFMSIESVLYVKNNDYNPVIEFKNDGSYHLGLDVNTCFGDFDLEENQVLSISDAGCTEACCDSDFSQKFTSMLPQVSGYEIETSTLILEVEGWGWIELARVSE